jgi:uncharacterized membrane protein
MAVRYEYSGPLPHPEILEHYDRIVPQGAERIFRQFEAQSEHRHKIESRVIRANTFVQIFGAIAAFIIGLTAIAGGLYLVYVGKGLEGFGAFFGGLASLVGVYFYGKKKQTEDLGKKAEK